MKKRIILTLTALIVFTFILALSISAADIITSNSDEFGTVNIVAGVNESTTIQDKTSRVVLLNADNTYSTFPAYYISDVKLQWQGTVQYKFDALNTALGTSYDMDSIVRIEILTDSTIMNQNGGSFQSRANLKEVVFPEGTQLTSLNGQQFKGSAIEKCCIPASVTSIGINLFEACTSLKVVTFEEGFSMTTLPQQMFNGCSALEKVVFPNCVETTGLSCFIGCSSLKELYLGENFKSFGSNGAGISNTVAIYAPSTFLSDASTISRYSFTSWGDYYANTPTLFLVGNRATAEALVAKADKNYSTLKNATLVEWDSEKEDSFYIPENPTTWTIVYGYNKCKAFYDNEHLPSQTTYEFEGEKYLSVCNQYSGCPRCLQSVPTKVCDALFVNKGYSKEKDGTSFTYGIAINEAEIQKYETATGVTLDYGFIVAYAGGTSQPLDQSGNALSGALKTSLTEEKYAEFISFKIKLTNIKNQALSLYCSAYIVDAGSVSYMGATVTDIAVPVTYASLPTKEN